MISLKSFIPEIKIQPNIRNFKIEIGTIWRWKGFPSLGPYVIVDLHNNDILYKDKNELDKNWWIDQMKITINAFDYGVYGNKTIELIGKIDKDKISPIIREIKIVPQEQIIQPAIGRYLCFINQLNQYDGYYSTYKIFDDNITSWICSNIKSHAMSPLLKGTIDQGIKDGKVKIFKDIDSLNKYKNNSLKEIKIVPNTIQPRIGMKWEYVEGYDPYSQVKTWTITDIKMDQIYYSKTGKYINIMSVDEFKQHIKNNEIKIIR